MIYNMPVLKQKGKLPAGSIMGQFELLQMGLWGNSGMSSECLDSFVIDRNISLICDLIRTHRDHFFQYLFTSSKLSLRDSVEETQIQYS